MPWKRIRKNTAADTMESFSRYWLDYEKADIRVTTRYAYSVIVNKHIVPYFAEKSLQSIKRADIYRYFAHLRDSKALNVNTIRKHYDLLFGIFTAAEQSEKIQASPMKGVRPPREKPYDNNVYDPDQIVKLFRALEGDRIELAVHLAVYLGLRRGEICGLRWGSVDLDGSAVHIIDNRTMAGATVIDGPLKTESSERSLKIPDGLAPTLLAAKARQEADRDSLGTGYEDSGYVFCYRNGRPFRPNFLSMLFAQTLERNGLPHIRFHDLRHTHGSIAILGAPLYDVSKSLGHSRQDITQKIYIKDYTHVKSAAVDSVDNALKSAMSGAAWSRQA